MVASFSRRSLYMEDSVSCSFGDCMLLPPPSPPPDSVTIAVHHKSKRLQTILIATACLLFLSSILLLSYHLLRNRRRLRIQQDQAPAPPNADDLFLDVGDDPEVDDGPHHVWLIRTVGLDESVIKSIAAIVYRSGEGLIDGGDCTVCLGEFTDGEVVKLLPKCNHAFHLSCIDTWLRSHVNCPVCRAPVVAPAAVGPTQEAIDSSTQTEVNQEESAISIDLTAGSSSSTSSGRLEEEDEVQPMRRSVSMDSSSLARLMLRVDLETEEKLGEEWKQLELRGAVILNKGGKGVDCSGKQPVAAIEMKRSLSSMSGRFFFSRYRHGRSHSILPL